jgi:hypothetical protein
LKSPLSVRALFPPIDTCDVENKTTPVLVMSIYNKLHQDSGGKANRGLTAKQFLSKEPNVKGYSNPTLFLEYLKSLRPPELEQTEQFFDFCKRGVRIIGSVVTRTDRSNRSYQHPAFLDGNTQTGCKVILEAGMKEFLQDYRSGKVSINFTLDELVEDAMND